MQVNLFSLNPNPQGGWITYLKHLVTGLKDAGHDPIIWKEADTANNTRERSYGFDLKYRRISVWDADELPGINIIASVQKNKIDEAHQLLEQGAWIVIHSPHDLYTQDLEQGIRENGNRVFVVRKALLKLLPKAIMQPHPYTQLSTPNSRLVGWKERGVLARCIARISFIKKTHLLLDANRLLPPELQIDIKGFDNRLYSRFKLRDEYPEYVQSDKSREYPTEYGMSYKLCQEAKYMFDMTDISKGDGGGTQYTFLEAMDAGALPCINSAWTDPHPNDEMKPEVNCMSFPDGAAIAEFIKSPFTYTESRSNRYSIGQMIANGQDVLDYHKPEPIARKMVETVFEDKSNV